MSDEAPIEKKAPRAASRSVFGKNLLKELKRREADKGGEPTSKQEMRQGDSFSRRLTDILKPRNAAAASPPDAGTADPATSAILPAGSGQAATPVPAAAAPSAGPVGSGERIVKQGDCISSIAKESGHFWETVWNDPANAALREARFDPNVLLPNDRVHVPPLREKWVTKSAETRHRFRRRGEPAMLRLTLQVDDVPLANEPYTLDIGGTTREGFTDPLGKLEQPIPPNARRGKLTVGAEKKRVYELELGHIDPLDSLSGMQKRLNNLGFDCGRADGQWDDASRQATRAFQKASGLAETGDPDDATRIKLRQLHGS